MKISGKGNSLPKLKKQDNKRALGFKKRGKAWKSDILGPKHK